MVLAVTGCKQEDLKDDVNALKDRVTLLEEQVKLLNENIAFFSKVLVRQTVDNGDGTFTEVPAYSISEVLVNDGTTFTAKFNDGNVLTLTIGSKGTVTTPQLGVNPETGKWMLNGSDTPYNAVGADSSVDGDKPEFNIALDNSQYYWQVRFNGTDWKPVTDADGNRVYVTEVDGELAKDNLFKDAKVKENEFVLTYYKNGDGQDPTAEVRIPIISDLSCVINVPEKGMADGYWEIGADGASAEVEIKGDHWFVIAPHGWEASISETLTDDGKAILTVKKSAPASAGLKSRATANNTDEVVVQVNKGMYWAVAKVKVREAVTSYYYQVYSQGGDITVGNVTINKATYSRGKLLSTDDATISEDGVVYFIPQGVDAVISSTSFNKLVLISDNPKGEPVVVDNNNSFNAIGTNGEFIAQNVIFKNAISPFMQINASGITLNNLILDGCKVPIASGGNFLNAFLGDDNSIDNIYLKGNRFAFNQTTAYAASRLFNLSGSTGSGENKVVYNRNLSADVSIINNVFYSTMTNDYSINGNILVLTTDGTDGIYSEKNTITIENNTFINFLCGSQPMIRGNIRGTVIFRNLLLWSNTNDEKAKTSYLLNVHSATPSVVTFENLLKFDKGKDIPTNYWNGTIPSGYTQTKVEAASSDPFDVSAGATFDLENGVFIPTAEYANYGAQQR